MLILNREELLKYCGPEYISEMISIIPDGLRISYIYRVKNINHARKISTKYSIPFLDSLHLAIAISTDAVLITRDRHFDNVKGYFKINAPEELL